MSKKSVDDKIQHVKSGKYCLVADGYIGHSLYIIGVEATPICSWSPGLMISITTSVGISIWSLFQRVA